MILNLPTDKDYETAEDILIFLDLLRVTELSDHIQRHTVVADPQDDKDSLIAEVACIVQKHTATLQARIVELEKNL